MTTAALAAPADEPPRRVADWIRQETGHQHAAWCTTVTCGGDCSTRRPVGGVQLEAYLPHGVDVPTVTITDPVTRQRIALDGPTAASLAHQILSVAHGSGLPTGWLRPPLS